MKSTRESAREKAPKAPPSKKKAEVKVVDVNLKAKRKAKASAPVSPVVQTKKLLKPKPAARQANIAGRDKARAVVREKLRAEAKARPHKGAKDEPITSAQMIAVPTEKLLRPFRKAAEQNRIQAKKLSRARSQKGSFLAKPIKKGKRFLIDLRVHAPGTVGYFANGGINPGPALVRLAQVKGLHMIALTEYYNVTYLDQVRSAIKPDCELVILPSVMLLCELGECKEVPLLVLFPETATSENINRLLEELQVPVAARGNKNYCLPNDFGSILECIERNGALAVPSRVDKTPYRQLAIKELVEKYGMHAFDLAHPDSPDFFRDRWPSGGFTFFSFSSANALGQIGNRVGKVSLAQLGFEGIKEIIQRRTPELSTLIEVEAA